VSCFSDYTGNPDVCNFDADKCCKKHCLNCLQARRTNTVVNPLSDDATTMDAKHPYFFLKAMLERAISFCKLIVIAVWDVAGFSIWRVGETFAPDCIRCSLGKILPRHWGRMLYRWAKAGYEMLWASEKRNTGKFAILFFWFIKARRPETRFPQSLVSASEGIRLS